MYWMLQDCQYRTGGKAYGRAEPKLGLPADSATFGGNVERWGRKGLGKKIAFWAKSENCEEKAVAERLTAGTSGQNPLS